MERTCEACNRPFTVVKGPGRPRRKCPTCSPPENRGAPPSPQPKPAEVRRLPVTAPIGLPTAVPAAIPGPRGVIQATQDALEAAGRAETPQGALALQLARTIVMGSHTASGLAALSKQLLSTLEAALDGAPAAPDLVDELKERRARRRGA